jgi:hypothetical protein
MELGKQIAAGPAEKLSQPLFSSKCMLASLVTSIDPDRQFFHQGEPFLQVGVSDQVDIGFRHINCISLPSAGRQQKKKEAEEQGYCDPAEIFQDCILMHNVYK